MVYQLKRASVLIVDDMLPMLSVVSHLLKTFGFTEIYQASDPDEGFELFCRYNPDLVIADWLMEPYNGIEMVRRMRQEEKSPNRFVPVVMMTGYSHRIRVEEARDIGVTEFLVKPFRAKDLYARIEQLIEKPRRFVDTGAFFGPDRRRRKMEAGGFRGQLRREGDEAPHEPEDIDMVEKDVAATLLRELRDKARDAGRDKDNDK